MTMLINDNAVVSINYTLTDDSGDVIDSSEGRGPLVYLHGANNIIVGLEAELTGKSTGDAFKVSIEPEQGYGPQVPEMIQTVPREAFEGIDSIEVGMMFTAQGPGGEQMIRVAAVDGDDITVDANHPMAGKTLHFDVEVVDVRESTEEERAHGHAH